MADEESEQRQLTWSDVPADFAAEFGEYGDFGRRYLLNPALFYLMGDLSGRRVLDAGCGQGYLARLLARRGALVTGVDSSAPLLQYACQREAAESLGIRYVLNNLSTYAEAGAAYDVVVANMVLMDIPDYLTAIEACLTHLRPGGQFIFSLCHPCFEEGDADFRAKGHVAVAEYFAEYVIPQRWGVRYHRPLSHYVNALIRRGATIRSISEPVIEPDQAQYPPELERNLHVPAFIIIECNK